MHNRAGFWVFVSVLLYPPMMAIGLVVAIMPPLNLVLIPAWFFLMAGLVGTLSNRIEACRARERSAVQERVRSRNAPGVFPVQRTNAL